MIIAEHDTDKKVLIIAEIGNNHEGSLDTAKKMIAAAARAGADAVKFQKIEPTKLVGPDQTQRIEQLNRFRLDDDSFLRLHETAQNEGVMFLTTPFDIEGARFLNDLVPAFKIASGDNNFYPLLEYVVSTGKPILLSTGMTEMAEIEEIIAFVCSAGAQEPKGPEIAVLHCVSNYPVAAENANLGAIESLKLRGLTVGYSDHTLGIEAAVLSTALGARIIEKHFTLDKNYSTFRDHSLSADPGEMAQLVRRIREAEVLLGSSKKTFLSCEQPIHEAARRSLTATCKIAKDEAIGPENTDWLRPGGPIAPSEYRILKGKKAVRTIAAGEKIGPEDLKT